MPDSHLVTDLNGWTKAVTDADLAGMLHLETFLNVNRDPKKQRQPITFPKPWETSVPVDEVTDEERAALREHLLKHSATRNL